MLKTLMKGCLAALVGVGLVACTSAYRLESGRYQITLETVSGMTEPVRVVEVQTAAAGAVAVRYPGHAVVLEGSLSGNRLVLVGEDAGSRLKFSGRLTADNLAEGEVIEKTGDETGRKTRFRLAPLR